MIYMIAQYVHKAIEAATPWLVGTAAGFFALWLFMLCYKAKPFVKELKWFFSLTPLHKFVVICTVSFFTLWGGSKERGILPSGLIDDISSTMTRVDETIQLRTLPENFSQPNGIHTHNGRMEIPHQFQKPKLCQRCSI